MSNETDQRVYRRDDGTYRVTWEIDVWADSPEAAAREALRIQRKPDSIATVFGVSGPGRCDETVTIDLWEIDADAKDFPNDPPGYAARVRALEAEGLTTSDAQGVADAEFSAG